MDDLTACYFCGTADGPVVPHPVVPEALEAPAADRRTVSVCAPCSEKLTTIQEAIVEAADEGVSTLPRDVEHGVDGEAEPAEVDDATASDRPSARAASGTPTDAVRPDESADSAVDRGGGGQSSREPEDLPESTQRIVRLLQNRSFPIDRSEIEAVATGAYDLDPGECAAAIDGLVQRGLLVEDEGQLDRPGQRE